MVAWGLGKPESQCQFPPHFQTDSFFHIRGSHQGKCLTLCMVMADEVEVVSVWVFVGDHNQPHLQRNKQQTG